MSFETTLENLTKKADELGERLSIIEYRLGNLEGFMQAKQNYQPPAYGKTPKYPPIKTKEQCEKLGGTWNDEEKACKLPKEKEEALEAFFGGGKVGILPTSTPSVSSAEARANELLKKIIGE